jgi:hypothetical protein
VEIFPTHSGHLDQTIRDHTLVLHAEPAHTQNKGAMKCGITERESQKDIFKQMLAINDMHACIIFMGKE